MKTAARLHISLAAVLLVSWAAPARAQSIARSITTPAAVRPSALTPTAAARTPVSPTALSSVAGSVVSLGSGIGLHFLPPARQDGAPQVRWRGGILLDDAFRDAARLPAPVDQEGARIASDVLLSATVILAQGIDATLVPLVQGDTDLAWQASLAHSLAMGLTLSLGEVVKRATARARPFARECAAGDRAGCQDSDAYQSFYSLHTGMAFTSAGFSCAMHATRDLYGDVAADASSCAASLALATATGLMRIASDRHYLSDVLVGAALGFVVGYVVPLVIVPERTPVREAQRTASAGPTFAVAPMVAPAPAGSGDAIGTAGLSVVGAF